MSAQHTQGRLYFLQKYPSVLHAKQGSHGRRVCCTESFGDKDENEANARRLAACWNACQAIPTEILERYYGDQGGIDEALEEASLRDHVNLYVQRNELLEALKKAVDRQGFTNDELITARALIAKATGGTA